MSADLTRVDSAVAGLSISDDKAPTSTEKEVKKDAKKQHRRTSSQSEGIWNIKDLGKASTPHEYLHSLTIISEEAKIEITLPIETQKTGWYVGFFPRLPARTSQTDLLSGNSTRHPTPLRTRTSSNSSSSTPQSRRLTCTSPWAWRSPPGI